MQAAYRLTSSENIFPQMPKQTNDPESRRYTEYQASALRPCLTLSGAFVMMSFIYGLWFTVVFWTALYAVLARSSAAAVLLALHIVGAIFLRVWLG